MQKDTQSTDVSDQSKARRLSWYRGASGSLPGWHLSASELLSPFGAFLMLPVGKARGPLTFLSACLSWSQKLLPQGYPCSRTWSAYPLCRLPGWQYLGKYWLQPLRGYRTEPLGQWFPMVQSSLFSLRTTAFRREVSESPRCLARSHSSFMHYKVVCDALWTVCGKGMCKSALVLKFGSDPFHIRIITGSGSMMVSFLLVLSLECVCSPSREGWTSHVKNCRKARRCSLSSERISLDSGRQVVDRQITLNQLGNKLTWGRVPIFKASLLGVCPYLKV